MKKLKKTAVLVLLLCMAATVFSGCGTQAVNETEATTGANSEETAPTTAAPEEKPGLKVLLHYATSDYNTMVPAKGLEEKTGYKVQYDMLPQDKPEDKLNIIMASGEAYDVVGLGSVFKQYYYDYAGRGALTDITPLIEKFGNNIKAGVSQESFDAIKLDGKIFCIPAKALNNTSSSIAFRVDWLEKLNLKMPGTLDELVAVLKEFKQKDPGGNGDKNIPLSAMGGSPLENIRGAFGLAQDWSEIGGKLVNTAENPAFKDYITFVTDLLKNGLLDKEYVITKEATMLEKFSSGKAGAMIGGWHLFPTISTSIVKNFPEAKVNYCGALTGKDGKAGLAMSAGFDSYNFVPKSSQYPEDAVKWLNAKLDPDTFLYQTLGVEGVHYTVKDGAYYPILPIFTEEFGNANNFRMGAVEDAFPTYWQARVRKDEMLFQGWKTVNSIPEEQKIIDPTAYSPFLPLLAKNYAQLNTMLNEYITKTIVKGDLEATCDAFVKNWKEAGGDAVTKEVNDWYATVKK